MARTPRKPKDVAAQAAAVPSAGPGPEHYIARTYHEIVSGDGVMRVEEGDYVVTTEDEGILVMPPSVFAATYAPAAAE